MNLNNNPMILRGINPFRINNLRQWKKGVAFNVKLRHNISYDESKRKQKYDYHYYEL